MENMTAEPRRTTIASLEEVMAYENNHVVTKFMEHWDVSLEEAQDLFAEMKKWLWLSADSIFRESQGAAKTPLSITFSMTLLDEMWHTFILFTMEYQRFCLRYFGFYLHHGPTTSTEKQAALAEIARDPEGFQERIERELTAQYSYIYDHLGAETLQKWYSDWTDKVTPEYLSALRKQPWLHPEHA